MQGHRELSVPVVVATTQSVTPANLRALLEASEEPLATILIDEAHHAIAGSAYERIITEVETAATATSPVITVGYTATPYRSDKQSMLSLLPTCAFARDIPDMVRDGWLAPLTWEPVQIDIDLDEMKTTRQWGEPDYAEEELAHKLVNTSITNAIVQQIAPKIGQRPTLVVTQSIKWPRRSLENHLLWKQR